MRVTLVYGDRLAVYDLGTAHPLKPERVTGSIALIRRNGLIGKGAMDLLEPATATGEDLLLVHDAAYIADVREASERPGEFTPRRGLGPGDTPVLAGMHEASALVAGGAIATMRAVLDGRTDRACGSRRFQPDSPGAVWSHTEVAGMPGAHRAESVDDAGDVTPGTRDPRDAHRRKLARCALHERDPA